ncbi:MAG: hypothetical protein WCF19_01220 [Chlamydiales bacterium]
MQEINGNGNWATYAVQEQKSFWGRHKVKILTGAAVVGGITSIALAALCWPAVFGCIGTWVMAHGIALATLSIAAKIGMVVGVGVLSTAYSIRALASYEPLKPREATPREATPREATPREATPREATPREATPREATPPEATPPEATPPEATPPEATPPEATPREATPPEATPPEATPPEATPPEALFYEPTSAEMMQLIDQIAIALQKQFRWPITEIKKILYDWGSHKEFREPSILICAYIYLQRIAKAWDLRTLSSWKPFIAALLCLSRKWNLDGYFSNKNFAYYLNIQPQSFTEIENICLKHLHQNIFVSVDDYKRVRSELLPKKMEQSNPSASRLA